MKTKFVLFLLLSLFFGALASKQNELITIPKEERQLIQVPEEILSSRVAEVIDGDSFVFESGNIIRLFGVDAPELSQTCTLITEIKDKETEEITIKEDIINCGLDAKLKLSNLVKNIEVKCYIKGKDAYDRFVGECGFQRYNRRSKRTDKININKEMILSGNAVAFTQISTKYVEDENRAKAENRGIWTTTFDMPSVYRKKNEK